MNNIKEISLYISKSTLVDGKMYWSAVSSDVDWDLYGEKMSFELYKSMISKINKNESPPEFFREEVTSEYWKGGMPYLSIAHFSDGNGKAVPGEVQKLYIDGKKLKAKGILFDNALGQAVWKSLKEDEFVNKNKTSPDKDRIRISIAFIDLAHKHGEMGEIFHRSSLTDVCEECQNHKGEKIYIDGYLVHLALTRVPVNPRTIMEIDPMAKKSKIETRQEDAESIVGEELVAEIKSNTLETKSEVLVEMSDTTPEPLVEESKDEKTEEKEDEEDGEYKKKSLSDEDVERIALKVKSLLSPSVAPEPVVQPTPLENELNNLYAKVNEVNALEGTVEEKLLAIQPSLSQVAEVIKSTVKDSTSVPQLSQPNHNDQVLELLSTLTNKVDGVINEVATLKAHTAVSTERVPVPRSAVIKSNAQQPVQAIKPGSVKDIVRRSVFRQ